MGATMRGVCSMPMWHDTFVGVVIKANKLVAEFFEFSFGKTF